MNFSRNSVSPYSLWQLFSNIILASADVPEYKHEYGTFMQDIPLKQILSDEGDLFEERFKYLD